MFQGKLNETKCFRRVDHIGRLLAYYICMSLTSSHVAENAAGLTISWSDLRTTSSNKQHRSRGARSQDRHTSRSISSPYLVVKIKLLTDLGVGSEWTPRLRPRTSEARYTGVESPFRLHLLRVLQPHLLCETMHNSCPWCLFDERMSRPHL